MKFGDLTYLEIKEAAEADWMVVIPTGCTEQQGPHLPVDFDTWLAETVCAAASTLAVEEYGVKSLVLPALPFGPTPEHRGFGAGFIDLPQELHEQVLDAALRSLIDQGFKRFILWRGCGRHRLKDMVHNLLAEADESISIFIPSMPYQRIWGKLGDPAVATAHADAFVTSIALHLRAEAVRQDEIRRPEFTMPDWSDPDVDLVNYSDTGSIGDPTMADPALGEVLWEATVAEVARILRDYDQQA
ncbi:MAG: creatininase family protein [Anaerolineales bacterium]